MTASDHLSSGQFFHGSPRRISGNIGDKSRPDTPNTNWFTANEADAEEYARGPRGGTGYVYRVQPTGPHEYDHTEDSYYSKHELKVLSRRKV